MTDRIAAARAAIGDSYVTGDTCEVDCHTLRLLCDLADTWSAIATTGSRHGGTSGRSGTTCRRWGPTRGRPSGRWRGSRSCAGLGSTRPTAWGG